MASPFSAAIAKMDEKIDQTMGEQIIITPTIAGDYAAAVDATRPVIDVIGLVDFVDPSSADLAKLDARVAYEELEAEILRAVLPDGWSIRKGDVVRLPDRPSQDYKVGRVDTSDPTRLRVNLCKIGAE